MEDNFKSISDFIKFKEHCIFCKTTLRPTVTNFIGTDGNGSAIICANLEDGKFSFPFQHVGSSYQLESNIVIYPDKNTLEFSFISSTSSIVPNAHLFPMSLTDEYVIRQNIDNIKPYIELVCINEKCNMGYHLCSSSFKLTKVGIAKSIWHIEPLKLFLESFKTKTLIVQNDWIEKVTRIYTLKNEEADPIKCQLIDFEGMDKDRLLNRIQLLITFS